MKAVILAAGKSSRLGGVNKLLIEAGGMPVHEWHRRSLHGYEVGAVVRPDHLEQVQEAAPWLSKVVAHDKADGPVGALLAYLEAADVTDQITVIYADTLLPQIKAQEGTWVGVAKAPGRVWDYYDGDWTRGIPYVQVCVGLYQFSCVGCVRCIARSLLAKANGEEVHMVDLIRSYDEEHLIQLLHVEGWQDAGDPEAVARVKPIGD